MSTLVEKGVRTVDGGMPKKQKDGKRCFFFSPFLTMLDHPFFLPFSVSSDSPRSAFHIRSFRLFPHSTFRMPHSILILGRLG
jgi:hypothetical protein